jgi:hypothetical protein
MGDKEAKYWDYRECAWVRCPQPEVVVPAQAQSADAGVEVARDVEADVRSG